MQGLSGKVFFLACTLCFCFSQLVQAETRRALLVGIDKYTPAQTTTTTSAADTTVEQHADSSPTKKPAIRGSWSDLDGAVNDVEAMRALLIARYGFQPDNIRVLTNAEATRERILTEMRQHLIEPATPGDVHVFFYAGHGSQVTNSRSTELDKKDETIVPADAHQGAWDIRDKELRHFFNEVLDKGASLTVFFDSCHSGSVARGLVPVGKARFLPPDPRDIGEVVGVEPDDARPAPEERGALVFSATQDYQLAKEATDEEHNTQHGAFTLALLHVLRTAPPHESASETFRRVKAKLQTNGSPQEPVLAGLVEHRQKPLFGSSTEGLSGRTTVAVLRIQTDGTVELQGGLAMGLRARTELRKVDSPPDTTPVRVRIEEVQGWSRAKARLIEGDPQSVQPGDLFEVDRWAPADVAELHVWWPPAFEYEELQRLMQELSALRKSEYVQWIEDPTETNPTHVLLWEGATWKLSWPEGREDDLGKALTGKLVLEKLTADTKDKAKLFVYFPPPTALVAGLGFGSTKISTIEVAAAPQQAQYLLVGRAQDKGIDYAWMLPALTRPGTELDSPLPARTDWVSAPDTHGSLKAAAGKLREFAQRLGRIRAWLQLEAPPGEGNFPYILVLKNIQTEKTLTEGTVSQGEQFRLVLQAEEAALKRGVEKRYVYVFSLDSFGNSTLLFPLKAQGVVENRVPIDTPPPAEIPLGTRFEIGPPFGVDTYILLTTREPISEPEVLEYQGIRTRGKEPETPLGRLLYRIGSETRGQKLLTPVDWSIAALSLKSMPKHLE